MVITKSFYEIVDSYFPFASYAWLCTCCSTDYCVSLILGHENFDKNGCNFIRKWFLLNSVWEMYFCFGGKLQVGTKKFKFEFFEGTLYMKSVSMPLMKWPYHFFKYIGGYHNFYGTGSLVPQHGLSSLTTATFSMTCDENSCWDTLKKFTQT